jgi:DMSO reductase family type II enzyme heme b subunit
MPSYEASITKEQGWALVYYVKSLAGPVVAKQPSSGKILAKKIAKEVPTDPDDTLWMRTRAARIPQMLLWDRPDATWREVHVKALHNGKDIAFRVEWKDATKDGAPALGLDTDNFRDGVALQFPVIEAESPPFFLMGHGEGRGEGAVNIWFWKADWQEAIDKGVQPAMPMKALLDQEMEKRVMEEAMAGWEKAMAGGGAGVFGTRVLVKSPVENLIAGGFGTLTMKGAESQNISGKGRWKDGVWSVVFKRSLEGSGDDVKFTQGKLTPIAFATWDGSQGEGDGRKAVTTWYYVVLEGK